MFTLFHFFDRFVSTANFWRHGRAPWRASGRAADRARPRGLADGAGGPLHGGDEPQRGQTAFISPHEDEKAAGLLLQTAGSPGPLQTSTKNSRCFLTMQAYRADSALHSYTHGKSQLCSDHSDAKRSKKPAVRQSGDTTCSV